MTQRIIVAVDDSAAGLAAASAAVEFAGDQAAALCFVTVREPGIDPTPIFDHADKLARRAGFEARSIVLEHGPPFEAVLSEAHRQQADLIVMGRSDKQRPGAPHVGSQTGHVLEFTDIPVLVIPTPHAPRRRSHRGARR